MPRKARERSATGCYHIMGRGINHTELRSFIRMTAGMECHEIPLYPETITTPLLRRLVEQEGAGISQLARLTGLARGDIRRRLL